MLLQTIHSRDLAAVGYDPMHMLLEVKFKISGRVYAFFEVKKQEYLEMMSSKSVGHYFNTEIKHKHKSMIVSR